MSQQVPNSNDERVERETENSLVKILALAFFGGALVGLPLAGYFIGQFIGIHMAAGDIQQGYAFGGLLYTVYNATHNPVYNVESQVSQSLGISLGQMDVTTLEVLGLAVGLILDVVVALVFHRVYKHL